MYNVRNMTNQPKPEIEKAVLDCLGIASDGLCPTEVAKLAGIQRITATKHLTRLRNEGKVRETTRRKIRIFRLVNQGTGVGQ